MIIAVYNDDVPVATENSRLPIAYTILRPESVLTGRQGCQESTATTCGAPDVYAPASV
jgi:hypothetical protein